MKRVLVVDDEEAILKVVDYALTEAGYEVHTARDGNGAEFMYSQVNPDLVILDLMLPGKSGLDIARDLRASSDVPIIMLSARGDEVDRVLGLEFGADDYVTKPFSPRELVSRVKAILRRVEGSGEEKAAIQVGDLVIDTRARHPGALRRADHHAVGSRGRGRPHPRPRVWRRRLRDQALLPTRARESGQGHPSPSQPGRRDPHAHRGRRLGGRHGLAAGLHAR